MKIKKADLEVLISREKERQFCAEQVKNQDLLA